MTEHKTNEEINEMERYEVSDVVGHGCQECVVTLDTGETVMRDGVEPAYQVYLRIARIDHEADLATYETVCCGLKFDGPLDLYDLVEDEEDTGVRH